MVRSTAAAFEGFMPGFAVITEDGVAKVVKLAGITKIDTSSVVEWYDDIAEASWRASVENDELRRQRFLEGRLKFPER